MKFPGKSSRIHYRLVEALGYTVLFGVLGYFSCFLVPFGFTKIFTWCYVYSLALSVCNWASCLTWCVDMAVSSVSIGWGISDRLSILIGCEYLLCCSMNVKMWRCPLVDVGVMGPIVSLI